jgi:hypothetical protein
MDVKSIQMPGNSPLATRTGWFINKTGSALTTAMKGRVLAVDTTNSVGETSAGNITRNLVAPAAGNLDGKIVVANHEVEIPINGVFEAVIEGECEALVDGGTIDVAAGDKLIASAASSNFTKSDATTDIVWAIALEANTGTAALKRILLRNGPTSPGTDETP